ncbi:MAG: C25 family cysteine peptidase [Chloroflexi bacterium]|nr:C25 family cysteine peptidase [Chloroflexota bacterium]MCI0576321.1 C25 family cysteine peptidase [Chloroflexota bacterium]MCI0650120.1 C25 family cysteine peptidase [Chloroflexota bacterium]MCI0731204.1 C25 family cysteine peptidase [Chloroflexota bacterium]
MRFSVYHHSRHLFVFGGGLLVILFFLLLPRPETAGAGPGQPDRDGVTVIESTGEGLIFEVLPPALERMAVTTGDGRFERIRLPGYGNLGQPGRPDLPHTSFLVALPPGAAPSVSLLEADSFQLEGVAVLPAAHQELVSYDWDNPNSVPEFATSYPVDEAAYSQDSLFPAGPVELSQPSRLRDQRVVQVWVRPVLANPAQQRLTVYTSLRIHVRFDYPDGRPTPAGSRPEGPAFEKILGDHLLNYEQARAWREAPDMSQAPPQISPCMDANAYRITLDQSGIYALSHAQLAAQGFPGSVPSSKIRMCYLDQEIRIRVEDGGDGTFGSSDTIAFYGQAIKTQETTTNVYWLTYSTGGPNGLRITAASDSAPGTTPDYHSPLLHLETDTSYLSPIPKSDLTDHWFWGGPLAGNQPPPPPPAPPYEDTLTVTFTVNNKAGGVYNVPVAVELWGHLLNDLHVFEVRLNGTLLGTGQFTGAGTADVSYLYQVNAPSSAVLDGPNIMHVKALDNDGDPTNNAHRMLVNWVEVTPRQQFVAVSNRLAFSQPTAGTWTFATSGFTVGSNVQIYNVTDPLNPTIQVVPAAGDVATFHRTTSGPTAYQLTTAGARLSPLAIVKDTLPSPLLSSTSHTADYIIITDPSLDAALTPLRTLRAGQGLAVKTVYVQDIFDEWSYGLYAPEAIKDFLEFAYNSWQGDREYVLLAGDASYDHRNVLGQNGTSNRVPVYLRSGVDSKLGEAAADNQYVDFDGNDLADMLLGRLPVQTPAELTVMVNKIITYETSPLSPGWHGRHFFVADNSIVPNGNPPPTCIPDLAGDFFAVTNNFIANHFPAGQLLHRLYYAPAACFPNATYPVIEPYYATMINTPPGNNMQERLVAHFNLGQNFVIYTGHSGTQVWGGETFFDTNLALNLNNGDRTPIMLPMTCLEGWYHTPGTSKGLSETLMKLNGAGAVASFAPTGFQVQTGHDYLLEGFYTTVFVNGDHVLGHATYGGKLNLFNNAPPGIYDDLQDTFILLGDPAMKLHIPEQVLETFLPAINKP